MSLRAIRHLRPGRQLARTATASAPTRTHRASSYIHPKIVPQPSSSQLASFVLRSAVPMVGFGFMDNTIMINMGEALDLTLGVRFGLSTLTAAAFGQVFSDVAGVLFGGTIEELAEKCGLPDPELTNDQKELQLVKLLSVTSQMGGVVIGCILGMGWLLTKDAEAAERMKKQKELSTLFDTLMEDGCRVVRSARCSLWLLDETKRVAFSKVAKGQLPSDQELERVFGEYDTGGEGYITGPELKAALITLNFNFTESEVDRVMCEYAGAQRDESGRRVLRLDAFRRVVNHVVLRGDHGQELRTGGIKAAVVASGQLLNVPDAHADPRFNKNWDRLTGFITKSVLAVPIKDKDGGVIGIIVAKNRILPNGETGNFTDGDEAVLQTVASHAAAFIKHVEGED